MDAVGGLLERITYDAYGEARHHDWRDVDGDGDYDATDRGIIASIPFQGYPITNANYNADADLNRDGVVNFTDVTLATTTYPTPLAKGELSYAHVGGRFGYDGYRFDPERREYKVRHRDYSPVLMRWMQRDPAGYVDGWNLYSAMNENPSVRADPLGLFFFITGPKATILSVVARFDTSLLDTGAIIDLWRRNTGQELTHGHATALRAAILELAQSANPTESLTSFDADSWFRFKESQEHRGFLVIRPRICCDNASTAVAWSHEDYEYDHGWTLDRTNAVNPMPGEGRFDFNGTPRISGGCVTFHYRHLMRVGDVGAVIAKLLTGSWPPLVWHEIEYSVCCDGSYSVTFSGSHFPTHYAYIDDTSVASQRQSDILDAVFARGQTYLQGGVGGAPGGMVLRGSAFHKASGKGVRTN